MMSCWVKGRVLFILRSKEVFNNACDKSAGKRTQAETSGEVVAACSFFARGLGWDSTTDVATGAEISRGFAGAISGVSVCGFGVPCLMSAMASGGRLAGCNASDMVLRVSVGFIRGQLLEKILEFGGRITGSLGGHSPNDRALAGGVGVSLTKPQAVAGRHSKALNGLQKLLREPVLRLELIRDDDGIGQSAANLLDLFEDGDGLNDGAKIEYGRPAGKQRHVGQTQNGAGHFGKAGGTIGDNEFKIGADLRQLRNDILGGVKLDGFNLRGGLLQPDGGRVLHVGINQDNSPPLFGKPDCEVNGDGGFSDSPLGI